MGSHFIKASLGLFERKHPTSFDEIVFVSHIDVDGNTILEAEGDIKTPPNPEIACRKKDDTSLEV